LENSKSIWLQQYHTRKPKGAVAVVGSPGLRSIGKLAIDSLIEQMQAKPAADLYSTHLPSIYQTTPSYAANPALPGEAGAIIEAGNPDLPKVQFYTVAKPPLILVRGYHANFQGQYLVAQQVVDYLEDAGCKRMIVVAGFGSKDKEKKIVCAAHTKESLAEMKEKYGIGTGYKGPFMGFSGLVFGLAKLKGIDAVCVFTGTEPKEDDLEFPDKEGADRAVVLLSQMLNLPKKA
jgi:proteasome assembly chaperone (PAC2) family protein